MNASTWPMPCSMATARRCASSVRVTSAASRAEHRALGQDFVQAARRFARARPILRRETRSDVALVSCLDRAELGGARARRAAPPGSRRGSPWACPSRAGRPAPAPPLRSPRPDRLLELRPVAPALRPTAGSGSRPARARRRARASASRWPRRFRAGAPPRPDAAPLARPARTSAARAALAAACACASSSTERSSACSASVKRCGAGGPGPFRGASEAPSPRGRACVRRRSARRAPPSRGLGSTAPRLAGWPRPAPPASRRRDRSRRADLRGRGRRARRASGSGRAAATGPPRPGRRRRLAQRRLGPGRHLHLDRADAAQLVGELGQGADHRHRVGEARGRVAGQGASQDLVEPSRHRDRRIALGDRQRVFGQPLEHEALLRLRIVGRQAAHHLVEDGAEASRGRCRASTWPPKPPACSGEQ